MLISYSLDETRTLQTESEVGSSNWFYIIPTGGKVLFTHTEMNEYELDWPSLEARRDQSSLLLFHKIHCGAVSIEKDKYMTPAHSLKTTRSSHSAQYRRHQTYSDALKNSFFPRTIPHWNSLPPSVANAQSTEEFRALLI